ncbi:hypothetical protein, unlikely [Trypanosoma brucei gambiense DAL972]|uniref:Uncharacterized protein n=1 Tax=Trypanosoma brucei gambiense (strain MHOM/CI/86/DAL972) TaxID=679716 RepID=C9ZN24_TRYB9|nr:hypothetical protein, unlikely [Trypanosoma brucei gambiense DAL972]CBH10678.1 hypothetical protein, unlikely [Trypanosoma brucei gambiense DAL972]|eukprot:XP_011772966.1 hypothetical protein, unlikely [Trypanosoma brucei gambiense DAL972]
MFVNGHYICEGGVFSRASAHSSSGVLVWQMFAVKDSKSYGKMVIMNALESTESVVSLWLTRLRPRGNINARFKEQNRNVSFTSTALCLHEKITNVNYLLD